VTASDLCALAATPSRKGGSDVEGGYATGSVPAEHGIGTLKRDYLSYSRSAAEIDVMRRLKAALDPKGILNPGKVICQGDVELGTV
jgi:hypothetical protein